MFIKSLTIKNFKCFAPKVEITFSIPGGNGLSGLNIFIGDNNTGKSTIFEALDFLRNKSPRGMSANDLKNIDQKDRKMFVEAIFSGNINEVVSSFAQDNKKEVIKKYIYEENELEHLKIRRSSENESTLLLWNREENSFKNESGIDAPLKRLFEFEFIWSDTNPNKEMSFGSTTITGNLLDNVISRFEDTEDYKDLNKKYHEVFNKEGALRTELTTIEERIQEIFINQFGQAEIKFHFDEFETKSFFKQTRIKVEDNDVETFIEDKGSGMQRSVALTLLQVYSEQLRKHPQKTNLTKPFIFFIDEPEICLHPRAQIRLSKALVDISASEQIFICTHSPFMFKGIDDYSKLGMHIFKRIGTGIEIDNINDKFGLLQRSPSWGEINYFAYEMPTVEFHDELYGRLHEIYISNASDQQDAGKRSKQNDFEKNFLQKKLDSGKKWTPEFGGTPKNEKDVTLSTFIRNKIHHPENKTMQASSYTDEEFKQSIETMINLIQENDQA